MKYLIVYDSQKMKYSSLPEMVVNSLNPNVAYEKTDLAKANLPHERFALIRKSFIPMETLLISLNGAGFECRTEMDSLSYNTLPGCFAVHIFENKPEHYGECFKFRLNISQYVVILADMTEAVVKRLKEENPGIMDIITCNMNSSENALKDVLSNITAETLLR